MSPLDEVAWLFNVRGNDLDFNPVALGYGLITQDRATLYVDEAKVSDALRASLKAEGVDVAAYEACAADVKALAAAGKALWVDPEKVSAALVAAAEEAAARDGQGPAKKAKTSKTQTLSSSKSSKRKSSSRAASPIPLAKAIKNDAEIEGMVEAHLRDGVAMASFWCWLDKQASEGKTHSEFEIGEVVPRSARSNPVSPRNPSRPSPARAARRHHPLPRQPGESARAVGADSLLLCDSGGQYECGTTDVTRTHHTGTPTAFQKDAYTRVLQGAHVRSLRRASQRTPRGSCWTCLRARTCGRRGSTTGTARATAWARL